MYVGTFIEEKLVDRSGDMSGTAGIMRKSSLVVCIRIVIIDNKLPGRDSFHLGALVLCRYKVQRKRQSKLASTCNI